jgi:hypothetical protein
MISLPVTAWIFGAVLLFWAVGAYNRLVRLRSDIVRAFTPLDEQLKVRHDLLQQHVELVGALLTPAAERVEALRAACLQVETARAHAASHPGAPGAIKSLRLADDILTEARARVTVQAVGGATTGDPKAQLADSEIALEFARRQFNEAVLRYNHAVRQLPTRLIAGIFGFAPAGTLGPPCPHCGSLGTMVDANALQYAKPDPLRDATDRLGRLQGALELKAALLALLLPAGSQRAARAFAIETIDIRPAASLLEHVQNLPGKARLPWFERLLERMALHPLALRQELLQATRRIMGARGQARAIDRLHWLAMRRGLGEVTTAKARDAGSADVSEWLETDLLAIAAYSAFLSRMVPVDAGDAEVPSALATAWYAVAMEPWRGGANLPGCEPPDGDGALRALATLQTLTLMQRPALVRGWVVAAFRQPSSNVVSDSAADALRLTCRLLDTPLPPELGAEYQAFEAAASV